jgi:hypothetical protein
VQRLERKSAILASDTSPAPDPVDPDPVDPDPVDPDPIPTPRRTSTLDLDRPPPPAADRQALLDEVDPVSPDDSPK